MGVVVFFLLAACASPGVETFPKQPPSEWLAQFYQANEFCTDLDGDYANSGEHYGNAMNNIGGPFLSDLVFNRLPGGQLPETVAISKGSLNGETIVTTIGETSHKVRYTSTCDLGWHVFKRSRTGQYLGDGEVEKQYDQVSYLRKGNAGELIARVIVDAEFNSNYFFSSKVKAEAWYRFRPVE